MGRRALSKKRAGRGFTLVDLMIAVVVIGVLLGFGIHRYNRYKMSAKVAKTASEITSLATAFVAYMAANEVYPPDSHEFLPPGMDEYIDPAIWADETPLGGHYNWEGSDTYPYVGLSIFQPTAPPEAIQLLDQMLDDGNLAFGKFRIEANGRPTLIIEDNP
ncbi:MAG: prepilin-type N-terminal cleavage/methylation domain-containing protein [Candidatus Latescibacteria bacterium]|nr:prepilin-type N-terminal cleavage/methylation domain-containing protein [Candidatus Latescibacterota bacterium]NIO30149.1 prepilin-type N-terminal cleavage/methylation domain-containing protein [Candidatus Latescibacterota bacterium]NIO57766.1 prepilin-type N-terminal cleavage/methylation domain-containing protein [Candidatus Latescibacterota bacterium]NIT03306.1 prepilin-type N-terminal cleavage/methylation domain-containing protein [Candidatus Latescibacterota bacterium]NIT39944.1 prepilin